MNETKPIATGNPLPNAAGSHRDWQTYVKQLLMSLSARLNVDMFDAVIAKEIKNLKQNRKELA